MPASALPRRTRVYQNHHLDSTRWDGFSHRPGDIVITTAYKAGTTWMQGIVSSLLFGDAPPKEPWLLTPWIDMRIHPIEAIRAELESQSHRRFIKTHLALTACPTGPR